MSTKPKAGGREAALLAAIQRKVPVSAVQPAEAVPSSAPVKIEPAEPEPSRLPGKGRQRRIGSATQFWFHDEDRQILRELAAWLAGQGVRPTDSMVLRAALRSVKTGTEFLQAYRRASELDGRLKRHKLG